MKSRMPCSFQLFVVVVGASLFCGCGSSSGPQPIVVNSVEDLESPPRGTVTLRAALETVAPGGTIRFHESLDGATIALSIVGEEHTILKGEVMGFDYENNISYLVGYVDRDYGRSALYARKDVAIDASELPSGVTLAWAGGADPPARVLAVYGDLTLDNVTITGGNSVAEEIVTYDPDAAPGAANSQPWTLARGGAVAVWGEARLTDCTLYDNHCLGDFDSSRDRGAFGGGLYANIVRLTDCVVSANTVVGGGAAGGGVYSVGGAATSRSVSTVERSSITGNRIRGLFVYGAGVYSDGGGIGNRKTLSLENCTIAQNLVEPARPGDLPENLPEAMLPFLLARGYWRGGGIYMSNGYLKLRSSTVVGNEVYGLPRTDALGKPNLAGGITATIGNAHAVETMTVEHSIVAGNTVYELGPGSDPVNSYGQDIFTGSLLHFLSGGHNRIGTIDFSQILVPVGEPNWETLCRKHYPKHGDEEGVDLAEVLDMAAGPTRAAAILSAGVDESQFVALHYQPRGSALDQVPATYPVASSYAEYEVLNGATDDFLAILLARLETHYGLAGFAAGFTAEFEEFLQTVDTDSEADGLQPYTDPDDVPILTLSDTLWFGPSVTWPKEAYNYPYIEFWHRLEDALLDQDIDGMGAEGLGEAAWAELFSPGPLAESENPDIVMTFLERTSTVVRAPVDQLGTTRAVDALGDIGAIELP